MVHTHIHSIYSGDSKLTPKYIIEQAVANNHTACAITDHGTIKGLKEFQEKALEKNIKPILGCEAYITESFSALLPNHLVLLIKDKNGYDNLNKLFELSVQKKRKNLRKRFFKINELFENKNGLIVTTACLSSVFSNLLKDKKIEKAEELFEIFSFEFNDDFFAEVQLSVCKEQKSYNDWIISQAKRLNIPVILTGDCHSLKKEKFLHYQNEKEFKEFNKIFKYNYKENLIDEWLDNTNIISDKVNFLIDV